MKTLEKLLSLMHPSLDTKALMEIITATPNPKIAGEILTDLYVAPYVDKTPSDKFVKDKKHQKNITFVSYDKWNDTVWYHYDILENVEIWIKKGAELPEFDSVPHGDIRRSWDIEKFINSLPIEERDKTKYARVTLYSGKVLGYNKTSALRVEWSNEQ